MLRKSLLIALLLALGASTAYATMTIRQGSSGEMLDAFVLPDGGSLIVSLSHKSEIFATYTAPDGSTTYERAPLQQTGVMPDRIFVGVCNDRVHVFANYLSAAPETVDGQIDEYVFEFEQDLGICENRVYRVSLPVIAQ